MTFTGDSGWQHVALVFQPRLMTKTVAVRIEGSGALWIAGLRLCPDEMPAGYVPAGELEVALTCPKSDASPARIQFDDEPAKARYCVTGKGSGARLKACVVNVYGESKQLADVPLASGDLPRYGTLDFGVFKSKPRGGFRVEAWVEREGKRVSPFNELVVYRLRRPRYWGKDAPQSPFGAHFMSSTRRIVMMKAIGVNWARFHDAGLEYIGWFWLEPEKGKWAFRDEDIARYRKHRIKIFAELGTAPRWASYLSEVDTGRKHIAYHDRYFQPKNLAEYANYCRTVVKRYRGVIDAYFVWNEPWIHAWWGRGYDAKKGGREGYIPSAEPQRDFVALMRTAYETVKSIDRNIPVSGVNTTTSKGFGSRSISGNEWTKGIVEHRGLQYCDTMDYHQYTPSLNGFPGDRVEEGLDWAIGPTRNEESQPPKPVWMSEGQGTNGRHAEAMYKHTVPYPHSDDYVDVANRLARYNLSMLANGVEKIFLYSAHGHGWFGGRNQWSVLVTPDGYAHPSAAAHSTLAWHLEDTTFREMVEVAEGVYAYLFEGQGRTAAVLSSKEKFGEHVIPDPPGLSAEDLFGNPLPANTGFGGKLVYLSRRGGLAELKAALKPK